MTEKVPWNISYEINSFKFFQEVVFLWEVFFHYLHNVYFRIMKLIL